MGNSISKKNLFGRIWDNLFGIANPISPTSSNLNQQVSNFQNQVITNSYGITAKYVYNSLQERVEAYTVNAALYSIVNRIAKTAAIAPFKVYRVKDEKKHLKYKAWTGENATPESIQRAMMMKELVYEEDSKHQLNKLIDRPNKWCRGTEFTINAIGFKLLSGNRFIRSVTADMGADNGKPISVEILPSQYMRIVSDGSLYGVAGYVFQMNGEPQQLDDIEIIHSKYFNPEFDNVGTQLWGLSPLSASYKNLTRTEAGLDRSVIMLQNGGSGGVIFKKGEQEWSEPEARAITNKVNRDINGINNANKIAAANGEMGFIPFGLSAVDMEILELEKYSWQQLCNIYGVPPGLFDPDKSGEHNAREFKKELITSAVLPELSSLRDDWNEIAARYGDDVYIDYDISVYPEMQEDQGILATRLANMPYLTWNEKRLVVGYDEDSEQPLMDNYFVPSGLTPIDQLKDNTDELLNGMVDDEEDIKN